MANNFVDLTNTLKDSGVTPGTYNASTITVDDKGRVVAASSGTIGDQDLATSAFMYDDFLAPTSAEISDLNATTSGGGSGAVASSSFTTGTEKCVGVIDMATGTTSSGRTTLATSLLAFATTTAALDFRTRLLTDSLGLVGSAFEVTFGFIDSNAGTDQHTNGIYFRFVGNGTNTAWTTVTSAAGVRTTNTTAVSVSTTTMQEFRIALNEAGTSVTFYIDNVSVAVHTLNIPANASKFGLGFKIRNQGSGVNHHLFLDWYSLKMTWTGGR